MSQEQQTGQPGAVDASPGGNSGHATAPVQSEASTTPLSAVVGHKTFVNPDGSFMSPEKSSSVSGWTRELPTSPGVFGHRNLENAGGRAPIQERVMFVGYVNWSEDRERGQGFKPMPRGSGKLRACRIEHPMTTESLTVGEWGGEWRRMDGGAVEAQTPNGTAQIKKEVS